MRKEKTTWKKAFMILMMLIITLSIVIAANDPGHDTLYVEQTGDSEITGNLNISGNLSVEDVIFSGVDLDVRGDGVQAAGSNNQIIGTSNALSIQSLGHIYINTLTGTTSMIYLGDGADTVNLNITGALYIQSGTATIGGSAICLANGTNCPSALGGANVTGPASSTDNAIARWNGAGGNVLQNSAVTIDDSNNLRTAGDINTSGGDICIEGGQCLSQMGSGTGTVTSVTAGDGMTQTGTATINPTLNVVSHAGTAGSIGTINIGADAIGTNLGTSSTTAYRGDYGNTAYTDRLKWDGGSTGLTASTGRTSLGATTIGSNLFNLTNPSAITFLRINADNTADTLNAADFRTAIGAGTGGGSVTSVAMTVPTGLTISGSPITTSGTLALSLTSGYTIPTTTNITNLGTAYTHSQIAGGDSVHVSTTENTNWDTAYTHSQIAGGDSVHVSTTENTNWDTAYTDRLKWDGGSTGLTASTGRTSLGATTIGSNLFNLTNPSAITFLRINADNTASTLNAADFRTAIGAGTGDGSGSVTSVAMTVPTGLTISGTPITTSGTLALSLTAGYTIPTTTNITNLGTAYTHSQIAGGDSVHVSTTENTNWDTAYTDRLKWDGGSTGLTASTGRTSLGATTIGSNLFNLTNPSAITFLRINANNTADALNAADFRTAIGAGTGGGSVTSVAMTVPTGLSISGTPITTSGTLALSLTAGYTIPTTTNITNLGTAYTHSQATTNVHGLTFTAEGSGGGLDADTLDGMDSSAFGDATAANQNTIIGYIDTEIAAILDDTGTSGVVLANDAITAAKIAADAIGASEAGFLTDSIGFAGADIATIKGYIDTEIAAILDDTGTSGVVIANDAITAAKIAADAIGASEAGFLTDSIGFAGADIATIKGYIDTEIGANTDSASMSSSLFAGQQAIYDNISKSRSESFTSSGTWNQPNGVTLVWVTMIGGGGGGGGGDGWGNQDGGGGGGAGMKYYRYPVEVSGDVTVTVGAAGSGGAGGNGGASMNGTSGGNTSFGSLVAEGGKFGGGVWTAAAGLGGNGGGYGGQNLGGAGGTGNGADPIHLTSYAIGGAGGGGGSEAGDSGQHGGSNLFHTKGLAAGAPTGGLGGGGGGGASAMGNGGNGGAATGGNGAAGTGYGAGGGGGAYYPGGQAGNGGAGSGGYILVEWIGPAN
ncbi:MAG: hypothetical protein KJ685_00975 [Nanoarchaeota archaeon]|nr:hypothetical protein [Nanoarchaeota archaeon]